MAKTWGKQFIEERETPGSLSAGGARSPTAQWAVQGRSPGRGQEGWAPSGPKAGVQAQADLLSPRTLVRGLTLPANIAGFILLHAFFQAKLTLADPLSSPEAI